MFSPTAWAKLIYLRDKGDTEIACFGLSLDLNNILYVDDVQMAGQESTSVTAEFTEQGLADHQAKWCIEEHLHPVQCQRVWIHTHPGNSATPSGTDWETFYEGPLWCKSDWYVMFILAKGGDTHCSLQVNTPSPMTIDIKHRIDWANKFGAADHDAWDAEYDRCLKSPSAYFGYGGWDVDDYYDSYRNWGQGQNQKVKKDNDGKAILDEIVETYGMRVDQTSVYPLYSLTASDLAEIDTKYGFKSAYDRRELLTAQRRMFGWDHPDWGDGPCPKEMRSILNAYDKAGTVELDDDDADLLKSWFGWWAVDLADSLQKMMFSETPDEPIAIELLD